MKLFWKRFEFFWYFIIGKKHPSSIIPRTGHSWYYWIMLASKVSIFIYKRNLPLDTLYLPYKILNIFNLPLRKFKISFWDFRFAWKLFIWYNLLYSGFFVKKSLANSKTISFYKGVLFEFKNKPEINLINFWILYKIKL